MRYFNGIIAIRKTVSFHVHHLRMTNKRKSFILMIMCEKSKRKRERKMSLFSRCLYFSVPWRHALAVSSWRQFTGLENCILLSTAKQERKTLFLWLIYNIITFFMRTTWVINSIWWRRMYGWGRELRVGEPLTIQEIKDYIKIRKENYCIWHEGWESRNGRDERWESKCAVRGWKEAAEEKISDSKMALIIVVVFIAFDGVCSIFVFSQFIANYDKVESKRRSRRSDDDVEYFQLIT